ncbi:YaiI/YqxD family protein [Pleomorphochaeta sp. DL1XJH-081]|uniref:YaiI/YqxD family protein n=1 Tax=Pleomorphochaeta sp. DL1XJH-081 TaxID=3409690 RepID=UPI003BB75502
MVEHKTPLAALYVDADSCPRQLRTIILKAVVKRRVSSIFAADRPLPDVVALEKKGLLDPDGIPLVKMIVVEKGDDSADDLLVELGGEGALAITRDIPLATRLAELGMVVIDDRGGSYTKETVKERLSMRNLMTELREYGVFVEKTRPMGPRDIQAFANALDRELTRMLKVRGTD